MYYAQEQGRYLQSFNPTSGVAHQQISSVTATAVIPFALRQSAVNKAIVPRSTLKLSSEYNVIPFSDQLELI